MNNLNPNTITLSGRHIIEASAGTGKTYNITELYIRLLLGKKLLPKNILVMTFTKDATQEIIGRVEKKLREVLASIIKEPFKLSIEDSEMIITKGDDNYKHLKRALLEIDEAAIFTIHGFCKKVLSEQAFASGIEMDITMETDTFAILEKTVEQYFRKHINSNKEKFELLRSQKCHTPEKFLDRNKLQSVVLSNYEILSASVISVEDINQAKKQQLELFKSNEKVVNNFLSKLGKGELEGKRIKEYHQVIDWLNGIDDISFPQNISVITRGTKISAKDTKPIFIGVKELRELCSDFQSSKAFNLIMLMCNDIRNKFQQAKEQASVMDFNDLIAKLNKSLQSSTDLVKTLQAQYPAALIDEFQDTDAQQYEILDAIYPKLPDCLLESGADRQGVEIDDNLLLMIGDPKQAIYGFRGGDIFTYLKAKQSCDSTNQWSMDTNWRSTSGMISAYNRLFYKDDLTIESAGVDIFGVGIGYQIVKPSLKVDPVDFKDDLDAVNYFYYEVSGDDNTGSILAKLTEYVANEVVSLLNRQVVKENDIAILVESGTQATLIQDALKNNGLTAVYLSQREHVYQSIEAREILHLMEGLHEFDNRSALKKALSTSLLGGTAEKFMNYQADDTQIWSDEIEGARALRLIWQKYGFMALIIEVIHTRMQLRQDNKHRAITNILHLAELIKVAENKYKHPNQLIKWYRQQIIADENSSKAELRLESDDNLIKIVTIHGSKGLEYPVVFVPFASKANTKKFNAKVFNKYYDKESSQTVYKLGKDDEITTFVNNETIDESKRLLYVAITRASQRCYIGVANYKSSEKSSLAQFLDYQKDGSWKDKLLAITNNSDNHSNIIDVLDYQKSQTTPLQQSIILDIDPESIHINTKLQANTISLANDNWQMLSFSKITKDSHHSVGLEKEDDELEDQTQELAHTTPKDLEFRFIAKKGADIGNLLHNVLEHTDFSGGVIDDDILKVQFNRYKVVVNDDYGKLKKWLEECLTAPINFRDSQLRSEMTLRTAFSLKDISNNKTLKEPEFYFPIKNNSLNKTKLMQILIKYRRESDNLSHNTESIEINFESIINYKIFGMLHGFIDLIFEHDGKFFVADYKSNYLGDKLEDYNQEAMSDKNRASFYDLQYLIYTVALDKYLEQSLDDYSYDEHFGGVYYFYLRGFKDGYGIYKARPSKAIVEDLKLLFGGN